MILTALTFSHFFCPGFAQTLLDEPFLLLVIMVSLFLKCLFLLLSNPVFSFLQIKT